jgi:DNA-3-methyladenine glycosylase II
MFLLFNSHRSDVLPIGDLAVRKGTAHVWGLKGHAKGGALCPEKDKHVIEECHMGFAPYRSISSYYMYKCVGM